MTGRDIILKECLEVAKDNNYNGIFLLPTGSGKGRFMIEVAKKINPDRILYLCDNTNLRDIMFKEELLKWGAESITPKITFTCYQSAYKWDETEWDLVLMDEFDASLSPKYSNVFKTIKSKYNIYVSATLDSEKRKIASTIGNIVYEQTLKDFIDRGILNNIKAYKVNYSLTDRENERYLNYNKDFKILLQEPKNNHAKLDKLKIQRKQFLSTLYNSAKATRWIADSLKEKDGQTLIFCGLSKQADRISPYSYHTNSTDTEVLNKFNNLEIPEMAVVEKVTRGVNMNNVKYIIHETIGTSKTKMVQKTGRGMRLASWDTLHLFFLIPHFRHPFKGYSPTIVEKWFEDVTADFKLKNVIQIDYKP